MFGELNKKSTVKEGIDTSNMEFKKLREFIGSNVNPVGFFITDGKFGEQAVVVTEDCLINMPSYAVDTFKNLSAEQIEQFAKIIYESGQNDWANTIKQINNQEAFVNGWMSEKAEKEHFEKYID